MHVSAGKLSIRTRRRRRRRVRYVQNDLSSSFIDWSGSRIFATHTATHVRIMHPILIKRKGSGEQLSETEVECSDECARGIQASGTHGRARRRNQLGIEAVGAAVPRCAAAAAAHGAPSESRAAAPAPAQQDRKEAWQAARGRRWARLNWGPRCLRGMGHLPGTPCTGDGRDSISFPPWALGRARPRSVWKKATATTAAQKRR